MGEEERVERDGEITPKGGAADGKEPGYKDDGRRRQFEGGRWIFCSDIAGLAPSELDIKSPCQVLPTLKDT